MTTISIMINGREQTLDAPPDMPLLWALRDVLGLTGTKYSCGIGICGSCTILLDGKASRACTISVAEAAGKQVTTIEGLSANGSFGVARDRRHPLQEAWIAEKVSQCGYCQPGQIMTAVALLNENPTPTDDDIDAAMADTLCRCGTYQRIRRAIHRAAEER
ncbi:MAG: (2Fe-2S)-binding protein [Chloroflexi bacterium]|nr:(2Fe-2S)-binding protein [Chloroflexota bacterium]